MGDAGRGVMVIAPAAALEKRLLHLAEFECDDGA